MQPVDLQNSGPKIEKTPSLPISELDAKISLIQNEILNLQFRLAAEKRTLYWSKGLDANFEMDDRLSDLRPQLTEILNTLHGDEGLTKDFERIEQPADIPKRFDTFQSLEIECLVLEKTIGRLEEILKRNYLQELVDSAIEEPASLIEKEMDAELQTLHAFDYDFYFWNKTPFWGSWSLSFIKKYQDTRPIAESMQDGIAFKLAGLKKGLEKTLANIAKSKTGSDSKNQQKLVIFLKKYDLFLGKLELELQVQQQKIPSVPFDDLTPTLLSYANALEQNLKELRDLHQLESELSTPLATTVFKGQIALKTMLALKEKGLEGTYAVYITAGLLNTAVVKKSFHPLSRMVTLMTSLFQKHAPAQLVLVEKERQVWKSVMGKKPLEKLYDEDETKDKLPRSLQTFLVKRVTALVYLPKLQEMDIKLMLLLQVIRSKPQLNRLFLEGLKEKRFRHLIKKYDAFNKDKVNERLHKLASQIVYLLLQASQSPSKILFYAEAMQRFSEFEKENDKNHSLKEFLLKKISAFEKKNPLIPKMAPSFSLSEFVTEQDPDNPGYSLITEWQRLDLKLDGKKKSFEGAPMRVLAVSLYGTEEKKEAVEHVANILELPEYVEFHPKFSEHLLALIYEYSMKKISLGNEMGKNEANFFRNGPVKAFLERDIQSPSVKIALYKLMKNEEALPKDKRIFTHYFDEYKGKFARQDFMEEFG